MRRTLLRTRAADRPLGIVGTARLQRRADELVRRLRPGDIAVVEHIDLDRAAADALVVAGVSAVVNTMPSMSGRYPAQGPQRLVAAGVVVIDDVGDGVFTAVRDGDWLRIDGATVYAEDGRALASGHRHDAQTMAAAAEQARAGLSHQLTAFASSAAEVVRREHVLLLDGVGVPHLHTAIAGRPVVVVAAGADAAADLKALRHYLRDQRPVLIGVGAGADVLRAAGRQADVVVGDSFDIGDDVLRAAADVVVATPDDVLAELQTARVQELGARPVRLMLSGTAEDAALLLADGHGATVIVTVGVRTTLLDVFDQHADVMAGTFLTRLRVGGKVVDARAVTALHRRPVPLLMLVALLVLTAVVIAATLLLSPHSAAYLHLASHRLHELSHWLRDNAP